MLKRACLTYTGRVQGVGFRFTARAVAERYAVQGYVKNITNGSVELLAEGEAAQVEAFLAEVETRLARYIAEKNVVWEQATGEYRQFDVRF